MAHVPGMLAAMVPGLFGKPDHLTATRQTSCQLQSPKGMSVESSGDHSATSSIKS